MLALLCLRAAPALPTIDTLVVLHTNDFHGYISPDGTRAAGLARIAAYFNRERARRSKVLALDAGDCVSGTPVSRTRWLPFKGLYKTTRYPAVGVVYLGLRYVPKLVQPTAQYYFQGHPRQCAATETEKVACLASRHQY